MMADDSRGGAGWSRRVAAAVGRLVSGRLPVALPEADSVIAIPEDGSSAVAAPDGLVAALPADDSVLAELRDAAVGPAD